MVPDQGLIELMWHRAEPEAAAYNKIHAQTPLTAAAAPLLNLLAQGRCGRR
jgi:hypothetical protein